MITDININGKDMTVIVLGEKQSVDVNDYRKAILNMFEMATLWHDFSSCIEDCQMWTILRFLKSLGFPEEEEGGEV